MAHQRDSGLRALMNQLDMQPGSDNYDSRQLILKAFNRCVIAGDQQRASSEPYYMHPNGGRRDP